MNPYILAVGVFGLVIAVVFFGDLAIDAIRKHEYIDLVIALAVAGGLVWAVVVYGDRLLH